METEWTLERKHRDGVVERVTAWVPETNWRLALEQLRAMDGDCYSEAEWESETESRFEGNALYRESEFLFCLTDEEALP